MKLPDVATMAESTYRQQNWLQKRGAAPESSSEAWLFNAELASITKQENVGMAWKLVRKHLQPVMDELHTAMAGMTLLREVEQYERKREELLYYSMAAVTIHARLMRGSGRAAGKIFALLFSGDSFDEKNLYVTDAYHAERRRADYKLTPYNDWLVRAEEPYRKRGLEFVPAYDPKRVEDMSHKFVVRCKQCGSDEVTIRQDTCTINDYVMACRQCGNNYPMEGEM